jgi:hypothetical protein
MIIFMRRIPENGQMKRLAHSCIQSWQNQRRFEATLEEEQNELSSEVNLELKKKVGRVNEVVIGEEVPKA